MGKDVALVVWWYTTQGKNNSCKSR